MALTLLQLQSGFKAYGAKVLFEDATFAINEGEHVGVIGPNGAGKTTLFKILVDKEHLDSGIVTKSQQLRLGYLEQESDWNVDEKVEDYLAKNCIKPLWELKQFGLKLGLSEDHFQSHLKQLSGGYRMRVKLLYLIGQEPNLLLLDEPTNFLDLETLLVLESFLQEFKGAFLLISHDREFLRRVTDHILEVESGDIVKFPGSLDDYFEQKQMLGEILQKQILSQQAKRKSIMDFVTRFGAKATKARQAQSRLKALEKMEVIEMKAAPTHSHIHIPPPSSTGKTILEVENVNCGYGDKVILKNVSLRLERGNHLGIVGLNGAGKSTLLKSLGEQIPLVTGSIKWGHQVSFSYFAQHTPEALNPQHTVLEAMASAAHKEVTQQEVLNIAGSLLFSGDNVHKKVHVLSGGEKSRVALGQILLQKSPLLLLDEPTNHLDFDTVEALTTALEKYEGTIITVSHDRGFIGRVANKILEVNNGLLTLYPGTYDEYVWSLQKGFLADRDFEKSESLVRAVPKSDELLGSKFNYKEERKRLEGLVKKAQKRIEDSDKKIAELSQLRDSLNNSLMTATGEKAASLAKDLHQLGSQIEEQEASMLQAMEEQEASEQDLKKLTGMT
ncbi:ABC-F family ATP-binding cassette domain-containing protein [Bdellovibrio reynosensis]|uniref:ATP-binding cassette domain-containing protein n=1 Tax=Bdellovibrio reynosensis TaxID=2835041 RepID=A0ABY4CES5_9BACT|nr:ABC-F family ATP-binding cassette domain-containing protein [Bdellovibrio reynosensis]UOF00715.1 ATP-binding cassette domain-containing protein [Bdellovibrio reynosensis]